MAVNVTAVPAQTGLADAATTTLTGKIGLTVMVTVLDVAGLLVLQIAVELITTLIASLFANEVEVYVEFVAPEMVFAPLYHW